MYMHGYYELQYTIDHVMLHIPYKMKIRREINLANQCLIQD